MLYNGYLLTANSFLWNWPNNGQTLIGKPLNIGHFYSGHNFLAPREMFKPSLPPYSGHPISFAGK